MKTLIPLLTLLPLVTACADDEPPPADDPAAVAAARLACEGADLVVPRALAGPGYDPDTGLLGEPLDEYVFHSTQLVTLQTDDPEYLKLNARIFAQLEETPGLVAYAVAFDRECSVSRTLGIWESEEAMYSFMLSGAHADAMRVTLDISTAGRVTSWKGTAADVETFGWDVAIERLRTVDNSAIYD